MAKIILWDWTGTLADESELDQSVCRSMEEEIAEKENISLTEAERIFKEYLKNLENSWEWHDYVLHGNNLGVDWKAAQEKNLNKLTLLPHVKDILIYTRDQGYKNILTTNSLHKVILLRANHSGLLDFYLPLFLYLNILTLFFLLLIPQKPTLPPTDNT